jgi:hypothetical protein
MGKSTGCSSAPACSPPRGSIRPTPPHAASGGFPGSPGYQQAPGNQTGRVHNLLSTICLTRATAHGYWEHLWNVAVRVDRAVLRLSPRVR